MASVNSLEELEENIETFEKREKLMKKMLEECLNYAVANSFQVERFM